MNNKRISTCILIVALLGCTNISAQTTSTDSAKLDYATIYARCLDADVSAALLLLGDSTKKMPDRDKQFITALRSRFGYDIDRSTYLVEKKSGIDPLLVIFHNYWRGSLLNNKTNYDSRLLAQLSTFFNVAADDSIIDLSIKKYITEHAFYTTGFGKTGRLYDLLVWKNQHDTVYAFTLQKETTRSRVFMMDDFITLGWEEYATLGKLYPGGWANAEALYCVTKGYDLNSEDFLISYLAHESRHFSDYVLFPKLSSADLEYRAKLTELSLARVTLYNTISFFISNASYESDNGHSVANYCAIRDVSKNIFGVEFEKDSLAWKKIPAERINKAAATVLSANTKSLSAAGPGIEKWIKKDAIKSKSDSPLAL